MNFSQWIIKNFKKKEAVIIHVVDETGRISTNWCIPYSDNTVKVPGIHKAVAISRETRLLSTKWNIPTWVVHHENCEAMDLDNLRESYFTADEMRLILDSDEANKVLNAGNTGKLSNDTFILMIVIVLGFFVMFYFFNTKLNDINAKIEVETPIVEVIE